MSVGVHRRPVHALFSNVETRILVPGIRDAEPVYGIAAHRRTSASTPLSHHLSSRRCSECRPGPRSGIFQRSCRWTRHACSWWRRVRSPHRRRVASTSRTPSALLAMSIRVSDEPSRQWFASTAPARARARAIRHYGLAGHRQGLSLKRVHQTCASEGINYGVANTELTRRTFAMARQAERSRQEPALSAREWQWPPVEPS